MTDAAKDYLIEHGFDPAFGARPLRRFISRSCETLIARKIIADDPAPGTVITIDLKDNELCAL